MAEISYPLSNRLGNKPTGVQKVVVQITANGSGVFPDVVVPVSGWLAEIRYKSGSVVPTTGLKMIAEEDGISFLGAGSVIDTAAPAVIVPVNTAGDAYLPGVASGVTIKLSENSVANAVAIVYLILAP